MTVSIVNRRKGELNLPLIYLSIFFILSSAVIYFYYNKIIPQIPCLFKVFTGHPCPTCGTTRLTLSLLNFNIIEAFFYNPLVFISGVLFFAWCLYGFYMAFSNKKIVVSLTNRDWVILRIIIVLSIILNWIYLELSGI